MFGGMHGVAFGEFVNNRLPAPAAVERLAGPLPARQPNVKRFEVYCSEAFPS